MSKDPEILPEEGDVPLFQYKDEVLGVLTVGLRNASSASPGLTGLKGMVTTRGLLSEEELGFIVHNINELLQSSESENADIRFDSHPCSTSSSDLLISRVVIRL